MSTLYERPYYPWLCWGIVAFIYLIQYGLLVLPSALTQQLQTAYAVSSTEIGVFSAAFLYTWVVMQIPCGMMFDKLNSRKLLFYSTLLLTLSCVLLAVSHHYWVGVFSRLLMGAAGAFSFVGALYLARNWFVVAIFPLIVGLTEAVSGIGEIGFPAIVTVLERTFSWRFVVLIIALLSLILALLVWMYVRDKQYESVKERVAEWHDFKKTLKDPRIWILGLYTGFGFAHYMVMADMWGIEFLQYKFHLSPIDAVLMNSIVIVGFTLGCPLVGWMARYFSEIRVILVCALFELAFLVTFAYSSVSIAGNIIFLFILGLMTAAIVLSFDVAERIVPRSHYGLTVGFINMFFGGVGILLMPVVGYVLHSARYTHEVSEPVSIIATGVLTVVCAVLINLRRDFVDTP